MTQEKLSEHAGISQGQVALIECGKREGEVAIYANRIKCTGAIVGWCERLKRLDDLSLKNVKLSCKYAGFPVYAVIGL